MASPEQDAPRLARLIAVAVGNTRSRTGVFEEGELAESGVDANAEGGAAERVLAAAKRLLAADGPSPVVVVGSVNPPEADRLTGLLRDAGLGLEVYRIGRDLGIPIETALDEDGVKTIGHDRLLNALGAFSLVGQACVVVDVGTAVTVDFVDGVGTFQGGAIGPGLAMMLDALHRGTAQLPAIKYQTPAEGAAWGVNTPDAMRLGVTAAVQGMVRHVAERCAERFGGYPTIIATGGDAGVLENDGIVERILPDLQLIGIKAACERALAEDDPA